MNPPKPLSFRILVRVVSALDFAVIFLIGVLYVLDGFYSPGSPEQFKLLLGAIGLTATLAALCYRASSAARNESRKAGFAQAGERMFRAVILFTFATILRYVYSEAASFGLGEAATLVIRILTAIPSLCAYFMGLYLAVTAVSTAHQLLRE